MVCLFEKWTAAAIGRIKAPLSFEPDGTEFEKKENDRPFNFHSVLFTLAGCLALLYILKKKQEPDWIFPEDLQERILKSFEKFMQSPDFPTNGGYPTPFKETMDSFQELFRMSRIDGPVFGFNNERSEWLDELGLDGPFAFREF